MFFDSLVWEGLSALCSSGSWKILCTLCKMARWALAHAESSFPKSPNDVRTTCQHAKDMQAFEPGT
eukprot:1250933-Amphidinium_carterae.1